MFVACTLKAATHTGEVVGNYSSQPGFPTSFQLVRLCGLRT